MSEVEKLVERLKYYGDPARAGYIPPQDILREAARRVEELEGALREAADVARMTAYHIEKTKRPTSGHRAMWVASLAPIARSALTHKEGEGNV